MTPFLASDFSNLGAFMICLPALALSVLLVLFGLLSRGRWFHVPAAIISVLSGLLLFDSVSYARGSDGLAAQQFGIGAFILGSVATLLAVVTKPRPPRPRQNGGHLLP